MKRKIIIIMLSAMILGAITIFGTLAYQMIPPQTITNTYTIGDIKIELFEKDSDGNKVTNGDEFKLQWETKYKHDVGIDVKPGSEACHAFIVMKNDLAAVESAAITPTLENNIPEDELYNTIATQTMKNGWTVFKTPSSNVTIYHKEIPANVSNSVSTVSFIQEFRTGNGNNYVSTGTSPQMSFTVYAIEKGALDRETAWGYLKQQFNDTLGSYE